jgi:hypothetical protein
VRVTGGFDGGEGCLNLHVMLQYHCKPVVFSGCCPSFRSRFPAFLCGFRWRNRRDNFINEGHRSSFS